MEPYTHVAYNPPVGILPTILVCVVLTITFWVLLAPNETPHQKKRRMKQLASVRAKANWNGIPTDGLKRKEVWDTISVVPLATEIVPTHCPCCGFVLSKYRSDFDTGVGEFRVTGMFCKNGDWTYLTWRPTNLDRRL